MILMYMVDKIGNDDKLSRFMRSSLLYDKFQNKVNGRDLVGLGSRRQGCPIHLRKFSHMRF